MALAGDIGCSAGPTMVGFIAGTSGNNLKSGFIIAAIFPALIIVCVLMLNEKNTKRNGRISNESES